jgi:hypothetical protein
MKRTLTILLLLIGMKSYSQYATKSYVDSLYKTLDSVIVKPTIITTTNQTVTIDTLTIENNSTHTFSLFLETDDDMAEKKVKVKNITGVYSIIKDKDELLLSTNNFMSSVPRWSIKLVNNYVVIQITGSKNKNIAWKLSKSIK